MTTIHYGMILLIGKINISILFMESLEEMITQEKLTFSQQVIKFFYLSHKNRLSNNFFQNIKLLELIQTNNWFVILQSYQ